MSCFENIAIIIPSLNPDEKLIKLVSELQRNGFRYIFIVNDGSKADCMWIFNQLDDNKTCKVLHHAINIGKGRALKTAMNYILSKIPDITGSITVDCDGQHRIEDICTCAGYLLEYPDKLIIGARDFSNENIPFRSRFGNIITRNIMRYLCGLRIADTQTGLRGISKDMMYMFLRTKGERFEFELNMLIDAKENLTEIYEFPIQTIYIDNNAGSHFNPLIDSLRIYMVFMKFLLSSVSSFVIDILFFNMFFNLFKSVLPLYYIILATICARVISSAINFTINKNRVFHNKSRNPLILFKYALLCIIQMMISAIMVNGLYSLLTFNVSYVKIIVDVCLFIISFQIQKEWVFKRK